MAEAMVGELRGAKTGLAEEDTCIYNKLLAVLNQLVELDKYLLFVEPVQEAVAPNYFSIITAPMDFSTMYTKVLDNEYDGWADFIADFDLMIANAQTYNAKASKVYGLASKLHERGLRVIQQARQPPTEAKRTLVLSHAECQNHITPAGFGQQYIKDMKAGQPGEAHGETGSGAGGAAATPGGASTPRQPAAWVPEQPNRVLEVWAALSQMQINVNGTAVLSVQQLTTSPTMNATLDEHVKAVSAGPGAPEPAGDDNPFAEDEAEAPVSVRRPSSTAASFSGRPSMPLLSRTATTPRDTPQAAPWARLPSGARGNCNAAFAAAAAAAVARADAEASAAATPSCGSKRRRASPDWSEDASPSSIQRTNSCVFMLDWVQPAVQLVHSTAYLERIAKEIERLHREPEMEVEGRGHQLFRCVSLTQKGDTFISKRSLHAALCASYTVCRAVDQVMAAQFRNAFCVVRPPGHHAGPSGSTRAEAADGKRGELVGQGFCLINHVAVGARYALQSHSVRRVAIIDWDLHHGNGTEACCLQTSRDAGGAPDMLFCSIHGASTEEAETPLFPGTARKPQVDLARGLVNIPLRQGTRPQEYMDLFQNVLCKAVREYGPDLIVLSAGFDAHKDDMFGFLRLSDNTYKQLTHCVMDLAEQVCHGRIVSVLEGGYTVATLSQCCQVHVKALATHNQPISLTESRRHKSKGSKSSGLDRLRRLRSGESVATISIASASSGGTPKPAPSAATELSSGAGEDPAATPAADGDSKSPARPPADSSSGQAPGPSVAVSPFLVIATSGGTDGDAAATDGAPTPSSGLQVLPAAVVADGSGSGDEAAASPGNPAPVKVRLKVKLPDDAEGGHQS